MFLPPFEVAFLSSTPVCWAPTLPCARLCASAEEKGAGRKPWHFSDPSFEVECSLGLCPHSSIDSSSTSVLSTLLFILVLLEQEWDHSFPMTSMLPYMLMNPSLQICLFSLVLRIFSEMKRHFKPNMFKWNDFPPTPIPAPIPPPSPPPCTAVFVTFVNSTSIPLLSWAKYLEVTPDSSWFYGPTYGAW